MGFFVAGPPSSLFPPLKPLSLAKESLIHCFFFPLKSYFFLYSSTYRAKYVLCVKEDF